LTATALLGVAEPEQAVLARHLSTPVGQPPKPVLPPPLSAKWPACVVSDSVFLSAAGNRLAP